MIRLLAALVAAALCVTAIPARGDTAEVGIRASVAVQPIEVQLTFVRATIATGQTTTARATITNRGSQPLTGTIVILRIHDSLVIRDGATRELGTIRAGKTEQANWQLCANPTGQEPLTHLAIAQVHAAYADNQLTAESPARQLAVTRRDNVKSCPTREVTTP
jgi:hypothetical protein